MLTSLQKSSATTETNFTWPRYAVLVEIARQREQTKKYTSSSLYSIRFYRVDRLLAVCRQALDL